MERLILCWLFIFTFITEAANAEFKNKILIPHETPKKEVYVGIDISKYQPKIDWSKLNNLDFVICKKSEGLTLEDAKYQHHIQNIPCLKGVYHFFRPQYSGIEQGKFFLKNLDTVCIDLKPVIDVEWSKWWTQSNRKIGIQRLCDMVDYIEKNLGCKPIIYTSPKFWNTFIGNDMQTKGIHLWVADWRGDTIPEVPNGFEGWHIWQQSSQMRIEGIDGDVDWNIAKSIDSLLLR